MSLGRRWPALNTSSLAVVAWGFLLELGAWPVCVLWALVSALWVFELCDVGLGVSAPLANAQRRCLANFLASDYYNN